LSSQSSGVPFPVPQGSGSGSFQASTSGKIRAAGQASGSRRASAASSRASRSDSSSRFTVGPRPPRKLSRRGRDVVGSTPLECTWLAPAVAESAQQQNNEHDDQD
jgi:hypothetical protein